MFPFLLLAFGCILIFLEFYFAGFILGSLGGLLVFARVIVFAMQNESIVSNIAYIAGVVLLLIFVCRFGIARVRATKGKGTLYSENNQEGFVASTYNRSSIGKEGIVITDLKPGGFILIDGKKEAAISQSGYITKGQKVLVIDGEGESLIVKAKEESV